MNVAEPVISGALPGPGSPAAPAGHERWRVLFRGGQRPLLLRTGGRAQQWLPYFIGDGLKKLYAGALLELSSLLPVLNLLPEHELLRANIQQLAQSAAAGATAAIQIGTTGPYQKASALLISERGEGLALAKIAIVPSADEMIGVEIGWLKEIEAIAGLADQVPRLMAEGVAADGRRYLVTSLAASTRATACFTPAHAEFLARLGRVRMQITGFQASPCYGELERSLAEIERSESCAGSAELRESLEQCRRTLAGFVGPFVMSHGDFAWWNIRVLPRGIFVFDWEYARTGANPLADFFHFHLIRRAAAGRNIRWQSLVTVLRRAEAFAQQAYPESRWGASIVAALALSYLLEVLLHHARAIGRIDRGGRVTRCYWNLMNRRSTWMAA